MASTRCIVAFYGHISGETASLTHTETASRVMRHMKGIATFNVTLPWIFFVLKAKMTFLFDGCSQSGAGTIITSAAKANPRHCWSIMPQIGCSFDGGSGNAVAVVGSRCCRIMGSIELWWCRWISIKIYVFMWVHKNTKLTTIFHSGKIFLPINILISRPKTKEQQQRHHNNINQYVYNSNIKNNIFLKLLVSPIWTLHWSQKRRRWNWKISNIDAGNFSVGQENKKITHP